MRRNSPGLRKLPLALAIVLALALTLLVGGVASASTGIAAVQAQSVSPICITATPPTQNVAVGQLARVIANVICFPPKSIAPLYVVATWGDGTSTKYLICLEVCHVPPFSVLTSHAYKTVGLYLPSLCLAPLPSTVVPQCARVKIQVLGLV